MTNNQEWFNQEYSEKVGEIEFELKDFQGQQLIIEGYLNLKSLYLLNNKNIDRIVLKNLPQLQECEIFNCGVKGLVIENCPQIKALDARSNSLNNLEFLTGLNLENLKELKLDDDVNVKLIEMLLDSQKENKESKLKYQGLKRFIKEEASVLLEKLGKNKKIEREGSVSSSPGNTEELMSVIGEIVKNTQEELEAQQLALETLEQKLKKTPSDNELQAKVKKYKEKVKKLKEKEKDLQIELAGARGKIEAKDEEILRTNEHLEKVLVIPTSQTTYQGFNVVSNVNQNIQAIYHLNYNNYQYQQELANIKQKYQDLDSTSEPASDSQRLKKSILFLATKQIFATKRQNTINKLIDTYQELDKEGQKFTKLADFGDAVSNASWIANIVPGAETAVNLLGKGISAVANFFKDDSLTEHAQKFEDCLLEDQKALILLQESYQFLNLNASQNSQSKINPLITEILKLNQSPVNHYDVFTIIEIQKNEELTAEKMKESIISLKQNFTTFVSELKQETIQSAEKMETLFAGNEGEILQSEIVELLNKLVGKSSEINELPKNVQQQIMIKNSELENLITSAKEKLQSKSIFPTDREEREEKLNSFFKNFPTNPDEFTQQLEKIKKNLSKKLTPEEINNLCQAKIELTKLQTELDNLQQNQMQTQIIYNPPKNS